MTILWICGLPEEVRLKACERTLSETSGAAWGWVLGHLPPPEGVELHVACPVPGLVEKEMHFGYMGAQWHCYRSIRGEQYLLRIPAIMKMRRLVAAVKPDVVNGWGGETGCGWIATWLSNRASVNVQGLLRMLKANEASSGLKARHGRWMDWRLREVVEAMTYRRAAKLFCESSQSQLGLRSLYGYDSEVIYQPLRSAFISSSSAPEQPGVPTFLYIGEMVDRKGPLDALRAFAELKDDAARLEMLGSGPLANEARKFVRVHGLEDRVRFGKGLQSEELLALMRRCDSFILPSYGDTGPTSLKEAMSQGLYPICYDNTGPKEHIERYGFGRLCATGKWRELTEAMEYVLAHRAELRKRGREAAKAIKRDLSPENIWPRILAAYGEMQ